MAKRGNSLLQALEDMDTEQEGSLGPAAEAALHLWPQYLRAAGGIAAARELVRGADEVGKMTRGDLLDRLEKGDTGAINFPWRDTFSLLHEALGNWLTFKPGQTDANGRAERFVPGEQDQAEGKDQAKDKGKGGEGHPRKR